MAEKRMFAQSIVMSDAFLDMPMSARCLYFTLGMLADDDGFVGAPKRIMRDCGASVDDMNILISKRFILLFETGVIVIKHWRINNLLRSDRYKPTTYLKEKELIEIDANGSYSEKLVYQMATNGIPNGNQMTTNGCRSIEKSSIGKSSIENILSDNELSDGIDWKALTDNFSVLSPSQPSLRGVLSPGRKNKIKTLLKTFTLDDIYEVFKLAEQSDFLTGRDGKWRACGFDWLIERANFQKVLEGNYTNNSTQNSKYSRGDQDRFTDTSLYKKDFDENGNYIGDLL